MIYITILNWNGGYDTIQCMESIFSSNYPHYRVIVCDNLSSDNSMGIMKAWAEGTHPPGKELNESLTPLINMLLPVPKSRAFLYFVEMKKY